MDYLELASFLRAMSELDDDLKAAISPSNVYKLFARSDDDGGGRLSDGEFGAALVAWSAEEWSDADEPRRAPAGGSRHPPWEDSRDASGGATGGSNKRLATGATRAVGVGCGRRQRGVRALRHGSPAKLRSPVAAGVRGLRVSPRGHRRRGE